MRIYLRIGLQDRQRFKFGLVSVEQNNKSFMLKPNREQVQRNSLMIRQLQTNVTLPLGIVLYLHKHRIRHRCLCYNDENPHLCKGRRILKVISSEIYLYDDCCSNQNFIRMKFFIKGNKNLNFSLLTVSTTYLYLSPNLFLKLTFRPLKQIMYY